MDFIKKEYEKLCRTSSDINEHLPTLSRYAAECDVVAELGVSSIRSTWALLKGLGESSGPGTKELFCVDVKDIFMGFVAHKAAEAGISLKFLNENSATVNFGKPVDLLFIDTWHIYGHLKRELAHHHANVSKYIILHDTEGDALLGEAIRMSYTDDCKVLKANLMRMAAEANYPVDEVARGLAPALAEFLETHPEWTVHEVFENNNGLTILKRK